MIQLEQLVFAVVAVGARVTGLLLFAPVLSSPSLPIRVKVALAVALTALLYPVVHLDRVETSGSEWVGICLSEFVIGLLLGLATNLIFDAMQFAGQVLGVQMGYSLVNVLDPNTQVDTPVLGVFHQMIAILIFLRLDVHHWLLRGMVRSFDYLPSGTSMITAGVVDGMYRAAASIWVCGLQIAAPALVATVIADVILAFIGKASPQLPVMLIGVSMKSMLGMATTIAAMALWPHWFERNFENSIGWTEHLFHLAH